MDTIGNDGMMRKFLTVFCIGVLTSVSLFSGCIDLDDPLSYFDKELRRAKPYLDEIVFNNEFLQSYALQLCQQYSSTEKEAIITCLYRHIVEEYTYISDPGEEELIRSPFETMELKGGDCEDLSILLMSLLENLNIKTYLVLTPDHAYALAYDVDIQNLWVYVEQALINQVEKDSGEALRQHYTDTFTLKKHQSWYYGGEGNNLNESTRFDYLNISYDVTSKRPIDLYIVPTKNDFDNFTDDNPFSTYLDHTITGQTRIQGICAYMKHHGGIILDNPSWIDTQVTIDFTFYSHPSFYKLFENNTIRSYEIEEKSCVVLEPTAGPYGYPGYDANTTGKKTAIDPVTKEYFFLE